MRLRPVSLVLLITLALAGRSPAAATVDFAKDVYPVLQRACFECHGPEKKKGGLRLDLREKAMGGGDSGASIVKGKPEESELLRRIALPKSDDDVMPNRGALLTPSEIEKVRAWIAAGADWPDNVKPAKHWAYVKPVKAPLPAGSSHPIDAFIRTRLAQEKLEPSPAADFRVLARRMYLDVIGLPPTPEEADAFATAANANLQAAVEALADKLLALSQYGEKWARPWLDMARYADSHGFQRDDLRDLWPYRDWVIRALNADMPYDEFTIEQLAGDLLPNATEAQKIATGFNRSAACNVEAGTDPEENRVNQVIDRVATLGAVWLGSTIECAQCHDHKYDPFTQRDFYGLFSFFNQTELEAERAKPNVPGSIAFIGPYLKVSDPASDQHREELIAHIAELRKALAQHQAEQPAKPTPVAAKSDATTGEVLKPTDFDSANGATHNLLDDSSVLLLGDPPDNDTYTVTVSTKLENITGFKLETLTDPSLPGEGPGRGDPARPNFVLNDFSVTAAPARRPEAARKVKLSGAFADFSQKNFEPASAIDGKNKRGGWAIMGGFHQPHWAVFQTAAPAGYRGGTVFTFKLAQEYGGGRTIGRLRLTALTGDLKAAPATKAAPADPALTRLNSELKAAEAELKELTGTQTLVMKEIEQSRPSAIFKRGDFRNPGDAVQPLTPAVLHPYQQDGPPNRLSLAKWLVSKENPLAARVYVNRMWNEIFGEGIVSTPEDFGVKGELPSHPELLDWLAVDFMEHDWSPKKLLREIVTSETYRQDSRATPESRERDPQNRLLARGPRFRMSAEGIRDNALAISGLFCARQFGPPIYPPQPAGLWAKVGGKKYEYNVSSGDEQYRRGIYVVLKRSAPYPSFINFDSTARLACRVKRVRSNTPLQALTLLNDPVYVDFAHALASRVQREEPTSDIDARLRYAFRVAVARAPSDHELELLHQLYTDELAHSDGHEEKAWFAVAAALLNLDETITKS